MKFTYESYIGLIKKLMEGDINLQGIVSGERPKRL